MIPLILLSFSCLIGVIFSIINHPLAIGLVLLCQTLLIALITGLLSPTFWFSYILFLVFLGGILVLFIYVTSLASNEIFSISTQAFLISITFVFGVVAFTFFNDPTLWAPTSPFDQANLLDLVNEQNNIHLLLKLYNNPTHFLTLLLVVYLFLTLIAVVTITQIFEGPLRSKN